jgi:WD40 repeat protein
MTIDPKKSKLANEFKHEAPLLSCAFDASGRFLLAGGRDRGLVLIDVAKGEKSMLAGHESWVGVMSRAGELLLTGDYVGRVIGWDCSGKVPQPRWTIEAHPSTIYGLSVSADGKTFATGDRDGSVRVWQTSDGKRFHELPRIEHPVYCVALLPDGKRIVTADRQPQKPRIKVWDIASGKEQLSIDIAELSGYRRVEDIEWGGIRAMNVSPDGSQIIACGRAGYDGQASALVYNTSDGKLQRKLSAALKGGFYYSAKFHPEGFLMTAGGDIGKGEVRLWKLDQDASLAEVVTPGPCTWVDIHPDGKRFAVSQMNMPKGSYPDSGSLVIYDWTG